MVCGWLYRRPPACASRSRAAGGLALRKALPQQIVAVLADAAPSGTMGQREVELYADLVCDPGVATNSLSQSSVADLRGCPLKAFGIFPRTHLAVLLWPCPPMRNLSLRSTAISRQGLLAPPPACHRVAFLISGLAVVPGGAAPPRL